MNLTRNDFKKKDKDTLVSKCGRYEIYRDKKIFYYPCIDGITCVNISYDYSMSFEEAIEVLNMVINKTWKTGQGRYLNGLKTSGLQGAINNFSKVK